MMIMIIGGDEFLSNVDYYRLLSIVGARRSGKDLLACELAVTYLDKGYRFYSNQFHVWNDPLFYTSLEEYNNDHSTLFWKKQYDGHFGFPYPSVRKRVVSLTEAGRYLRRYDYFEDMFEFAGKYDSYFFFPSVRESHADLMTLVCYPFPSFRRLFGITGGLWGYAINDGYSPKQQGTFWFFPGSKYKGVYDTQDISESPTVYLEVIKREIEIDAWCRGRDGVPSLEEALRQTDDSHQAKHQKQIISDLVSLSSKKRR